MTVENSALPSQKKKSCNISQYYCFYFYVTFDHLDDHGRQKQNFSDPKLLKSSVY